MAPAYPLPFGQGRIYRRAASGDVTSYARVMRFLKVASCQSRLLRLTATKSRYRPRCAMDSNRCMAVFRRRCRRPEMGRDWTQAWRPL